MLWSISLHCSNGYMFWVLVLQNIHFQECTVFIRVLVSAKNVYLLKTAAATTVISCGDAVFNIICIVTFSNPHSVLNVGQNIAFWPYSTCLMCSCDMQHTVSGLFFNSGFLLGTLPKYQMLGLHTQIVPVLSIFIRFAMGLYTRLLWLMLPLSVLMVGPFLDGCGLMQ